MLSRNNLMFTDLKIVPIKIQQRSECKHTRQRGFTLIEIMVVVIVIAVVSVAVATTVGRSTDRSARLEAQRFMAVVNEVRDEAVIIGLSYVLLVDDGAQTYRFESTRETNGSQSNDNLFKVRSVRDDVKIEWDVLEVIDTDPKAKPKVYISSLGEITPFEMRMSGDKHDYIVFVNDEGNLETREKGSRFL